MSESSNRTINARDYMDTAVMRKILTTANSKQQQPQPQQQPKDEQGPTANDECGRGEISPPMYFPSRPARLLSCLCALRART